MVHTARKCVYKGNLISIKLEDCLNFPCNVYLKDAEGKYWNNQDKDRIFEYSQLENNTEQITPSTNRVKIPFINRYGEMIGLLEILFPPQEAAPDPIPEEQSTSENISMTKRERECLLYLSQGKSAKEIARLLNLSWRTIEYYIENMKKKWGCTKRTELVVKAFNLIK